MKCVAFMGESDLVDVVFTNAERVTLARAAKILGQLREKRAYDDDDLGVDIALAAYVIADLLEGPVPA